jgi:hypothetical protein
MRPLVLLLLAAAAAATPDDVQREETNPRSPGTPLEITWRPFTVLTFTKGKELVDALDPKAETRPESFTMMRMPVEELAKTLDLDPGWIAIKGPSVKILSTLRRTKVKIKDSVFMKADLERLKEVFPRLAIGREGASLDPLQRAVLYHIKVHRVYSHFAALTNNKKPFLGMKSHYELYLFEDYTSHHTFVDKFIGRANDKAGVQHHDRAEPNFMAFTSCMDNVGTKDVLMANHVVSNVVMNFADGHGNYYRETWGWLEEGLAHYYERRENPRYNTFHWSEGKPPGDFKKPDWESTIYGLVRRGKDPPLNRWCEKLQPGELTGIENGTSWSIVKWLVETEPIRFTKMLVKLDDFENKPSCAECIEYAFNVTPSVLHQRWRDYVLEHYNK